MSTVPGHAGFTFVGDRSTEFYRDAVGFVDKHIEENKSKIFLSRLLNKPTVFIASNPGVRAVLDDADGCLDLGYQSFMGGVYGENVLFSSGDDAQCLRAILHGLFSSGAVLQFHETITRLTLRALQSIKDGELTHVYTLLKRLCTEICLSIFLDIDFVNSTDLAEKIVSLTTEHWHGIISVPLKIPMVSGSSYAKALDAKEQLLKIIEERLAKSSGGFPHTVHQSNFPGSAGASHHILLFTSALVPKALASILTSYVVFLGQKPHHQRDVVNDPEALRRVLLETQRLAPPFFGGRRLVRKDTLVEGYHIPAGSAIVYMTRHAQRDETVFKTPDQFHPDRWLHANVEDEDRLFLFGGGSRSCVGKHLVDAILKTVATRLIESFSWSPPENKSLTYKWLPVSRPVEGVHVIFTAR